MNSSCKHRRKEAAVAPNLCARSFYFPYLLKRFVVQKVGLLEQGKTIVGRIIQEVSLEKNLSAFQNSYVGTHS